MSTHALALDVRAAMSHVRPDVSQLEAVSVENVIFLADRTPQLSEDRVTTARYPSRWRRTISYATAWLMLVVAIVGIAGGVAGLVTVTNDSGDRYAVFATIASATTRQDFARERGF